MEKVKLQVHFLAIIAVILSMTDICHSACKDYWSRCPEYAKFGHCSTDYKVKAFCCQSCKDCKLVLANCKFPFTFGGFTYNTCARKSSFNTEGKRTRPKEPWCSTKVNEDGRHVSAKYGDGNWQYCGKCVNAYEDYSILCPKYAKRGDCTNYKSEWMVGMCAKSCNGAYIQVNEENCWGPCGKKGGSCPTFCGDNGFCCRKGFDDCSTDMAAVSPKLHTCVTKNYETLTSGGKCPLPLSQVHCKSDAQRNGKRFHIVDKAGYPTGCFQWWKSTSYYFNTRTTDAKCSTNNRCICVKDWNPWNT